MYRVWYWAIVGREADGRFIASIPDLKNLSAYGTNEKDVCASLTKLAAEHIRLLLDSGQSIPRSRSAAELPAFPQQNKIGRAMVPVPIGQTRAAPKSDRPT